MVWRAPHTVGSGCALTISTLHLVHWQRYFQKACVLISLERYEEALADLKKASEGKNPAQATSGFVGSACAEGSVLGSKGGLRALPARQGQAGRFRSWKSVRAGNRR